MSTTTTSTISQVKQQAESLSAASAQRIGLMVWAVLALIAAVAVGAMIGLAPAGAAEIDGAYRLGGLFLLSAGAFLLGVPAAWFIHVLCYRRFWRGGLVHPKGFLIASITLWGIMELIILIVTAVAIVRQSLVPDLFLAIITILLLLMSVPNGWAMTHRMRKHEIDDEEELLHIPPKREPE